MIALALCVSPIRLTENGGHFRRFEIPDRSLGRLLKRNLQHLGALKSRERFLRGNETKEASQSGQPAVPCNDGRPARLLDVLQECCYLGAIQIVEDKRGDLDLLPFSDETEKQPPSVSVSNSWKNAYNSLGSDGIVFTGITVFLE
jgi:hypothetical protein